MNDSHKHHSHTHHFGSWMRHMAHVPKGFLKYSVLKMLDEKSLSGTEIMKEIEKKTDGYWKPSPGSIYPLLGWLQEKKYTKEVPDQESSMKRYTLTTEGKALLKEHTKRKNEIQDRFGTFTPPFQRFSWPNNQPEKTQGLVECEKKFIKTSWKLLEKLHENYSEEAVTEAKEAINQANEKLKEINARLQKTE